MKKRGTRTLMICTSGLLVLGLGWGVNHYSLDLRFPKLSMPRSTAPVVNIKTTGIVTKAVGDEEPVLPRTPPYDSTTGERFFKSISQSGATELPTSKPRTVSRISPIDQAVQNEFSRTSTSINYWNTKPLEVNAKQSVVLSFDDGPSPYTGELISTLNAEHVPALFFWNTYHISYANQKVVQMLENSPNILVGDHTTDHSNLLLLGQSAQEKEITNAQQVIQTLLQKPVYFFRPPYGNYNRVTEQILNKDRLVAVMWDDDSEDWMYNSNEQAILHQIRSELHPGAIILLHDHPDTIRFLPDIIRMIRASGYQFTTPVTPTQVR